MNIKQNKIRLGLLMSFMVVGASCANLDGGSLNASANKQHKQVPNVTSNAPVTAAVVHATVNNKDNANTEGKGWGYNIDSMGNLIKTANNINIVNNKFKKLSKEYNNTITNMQNVTNTTRNFYQYISDKISNKVTVPYFVYDTFMGAFMVASLFLFSNTSFVGLGAGAVGFAGGYYKMSKIDPTQGGFFSLFKRMYDKSSFIQGVTCSIPVLLSIYCFSSLPWCVAWTILLAMIFVCKPKEKVIKN